LRGHARRGVDYAHRNVRKRHSILTGFKRNNNLSQSSGFGRRILKMKADSHRVIHQERKARHARGKPILRFSVRTVELEKPLN